MPEQTLGGIPLGLGTVMKINFFEFSCSCMYVYMDMYICTLLMWLYWNFLNSYAFWFANRCMFPGYMYMYMYIKVLHCHVYIILP